MRQLERREFLGAAGLAAIAGRAVSAEKRIPAGIIGTAHPHASGHLAAIRSSANYQFVAAAEPNPDLLRKAQQNQKWEGVTWVGVEQLLADKSIQMICIETDPLDSLPYALRSIQADKHTKIDKPPGADLDALKQIFAEAERLRLLVQMGYAYRYHPAFRLAFRAVREGWLGPIQSVVCQMNDMLTPEQRKRLDRYPGGQMFEICGHMIDALVWLMGEPKRVSPVLRHSDPVDDPLEDDVLAMFEFDSAVAVVKSHTRDGERYFYVFGREGSIQIDNPSRPRVRLTLGNPRGEFQAGTHEIPVEKPAGYERDLNDLAQAIREGRHVEFFTPEHDLRVHRTLLRACGLSV